MGTVLEVIKEGITGLDYSSYDVLRARVAGAFQTGEAWKEEVQTIEVPKAVREQPPSCKSV